MNRSKAIRLGNAKSEQLEKAISARDYTRLLKLKLQSVFREKRLHDQAVTQLDKYGVMPNEREAERVRLAILKLSGANLAEIESHVKGAKEDYLDLINWAESPAQTRLAMRNQKLSATVKSRVLEQDQRDYENWLRQGE